MSRKIAVMDRHGRSNSDAVVNSGDRHRIAEVQANSVSVPRIQCGYFRSSTRIGDSSLKVIRVSAGTLTELPFVKT